MWVNPEAGKTWEEIAEIVWRDLTPEGRVRWHALLASTGKTPADLCRELCAQFRQRVAAAEDDPSSPFAQDLERMRFPFGRDPRLEG
jgi:hypothetical protein